MANVGLEYEPAKHTADIVSARIVIRKYFLLIISFSFLIIVIVSVFVKRCHFIDGAKVVRIFRVAIKKRLISCSIVATDTRIHDRTGEYLQNVSQKGAKQWFLCDFRCGARATKVRTVPRSHDRTTFNDN